MTIKTTGWGVVQTLDVEADTKVALLSAITIAMTYSETVRAFRETRDGSNTRLLILYKLPLDRATSFLTPIKSPEVMCNHIIDWLAQDEVKPNKNPYEYADGSTRKGFKLFKPTPAYVHDNKSAIIDAYNCAFIVQPHYIYYSK